MPGERRFQPKPDHSDGHHRLDQSQDGEVDDEPDWNRDIKPYLPPAEQHETDQPYAPPPAHPDDVPYDPELDRKWRRDRGLPDRDNGDDDDRSRRDNNDVDPTIVDYSV